MVPSVRAVELQGDFGIANLVVCERPRPEPGPGQVRVAVTAASLNYRDILMVQGSYNPKQPLPLVPCSDGVGLIDGVGEGVDAARIGQRVAGLFAPRWRAGEPRADDIRHTLGGPLEGMLAEAVVLDEGAVVVVPRHLSDAEASTLPCAAVTAWRAVVTFGNVAASDVVLVQGTGGVSTFALDFALAHGARVIGTSGTDEGCAWLEQRGAHETINYRSLPKWGRRVRELTEDRGADLIVEVGGAGTLQQSLAAVRSGGMVALIGVLAGAGAPLNLLPVLMRQIRVQGVFVGPKEDFVAMNRAISHHRLEPHVDRTFALDDVRDAFEYVAAAKHRGKVCIQVSS